jgi:GPH family glycoside/pentoside/hexuronide:cation symporter
MEHYATKLQDRIPFHHKLIYGLGAFVNNLLAAAIGGMIIVLNLGLGMNPALVGLVGALPRLTDAITDPLMGFISDNTRSRWGRRRPYIFVGAIAAGLIYIALWQLPLDKGESFYFWYFLIGSFFFYLAYTVFATPWVALGYELTPDYHERTRLMGVQNFVGQIPYMIAPYFLAIMYNKTWFEDEVGLRSASCRRSSCASDSRMSPRSRRRKKGRNRSTRAASLCATSWNSCAASSSP